MSEPVNFEVRVLGRVGPAGREALADVDVRVEPAMTRLTAALDQAAPARSSRGPWGVRLGNRRRASDRDVAQGRRL